MNHEPEELGGVVVQQTERRDEKKRVPGGFHIRSASFFDQPTVRWSWSSCAAEYGLPPESKSFAAAQYSMKSLIICLDTSAEEDRVRM
jgi:hypothetical protein